MRWTVDGLTPCSIMQASTEAVSRSTPKISTSTSRTVSKLRSTHSATRLPLGVRATTPYRSWSTRWRRFSFCSTPDTVAALTPSPCARSRTWATRWSPRTLYSVFRYISWVSEIGFCRCMVFSARPRPRSIRHFLRRTKQFSAALRYGNFRPLVARAHEACGCSQGEERHEVEGEARHAVAEGQARPAQHDEQDRDGRVPEPAAPGGEGREHGGRKREGQMMLLRDR